MDRIRSIICIIRKAPMPVNRIANVADQGGIGLVQADHFGLKLTDIGLKLLKK